MTGYGRDIAHEECVKIALFPLNGGLTSMRTSTLPLTQLLVEPEQETLLAPFRAALHPLTLCHERNFLADSRQDNHVWLLFDFDDLLASILREENSCILHEHHAQVSRLRTRTCIRIYRSIVRRRHILLEVIVVIVVDVLIVYAVYKGIFAGGFIAHTVSILIPIVWCFIFVLIIGGGLQGSMYADRVTLMQTPLTIIRGLGGGLCTGAISTSPSSSTI